MPNLIAAILAAFFAGIFLSNSINAEMHCLVIRPGFGLVSELCPAHTVSCRIRIENDAISFYEYSPLYDRNQFVCLLKGELGNQKGSGCVRKRSGHIRCWCFGRSNCNTPENSKLLYSTFASGDEAKFMAAIEQIDFVDLAEEEGNYEPQKNAAISTTTTEIAKIAQKLMPKINGNEEKIKPPTTTLAPIKNEKIKNKFEIKQKLETTTKMHLEKVKLSTKSSENERMASKTFPIHSTTTIAPSISSGRIGQNKNGQNGSQQLRSEFDRRNRIHIIHVSARDRYEPVNVFGSPALQRIMEKERKLLKAQVEKASLEESADGGDEGELEELEEDWEWGEGESHEWEREEVEEANQPKKIAERSQKQKPSKNSSLLKIRLEQKQRSSDSASTELEEERALAEEYFDSALYATGGSSKSTISTEIAFSLLFPFLLAILY